MISRVRAPGATAQTWIASCTVCAARARVAGIRGTIRKNLGISSRWTSVARGTSRNRQKTDEQPQLHDEACVSSDILEG